MVNGGGDVCNLTTLARQLNAFADGLKNARAVTKQKTLRELATEYMTNLPNDFPDILFDDNDLTWLNS